MFNQFLRQREIIWNICCKMTCVIQKNYLVVSKKTETNVWLTKQLKQIYYLLQTS